MITVIVPIHNTKKYIGECLESIINQSYKNIEILLIDSSTDNTKKVIDQYLKHDNRIQYFYSRNNSYGFKVNYGIKKAKGEYISIIDSDDYIHKDFYKSASYYINKYRPDFVKYDFYKCYHNKSNKVVKKYVYNLSNKMLYNMICNSRNNPEILYMNCTSIWSGLYSRQFLLQNNIKMLETKGASFQDTSFYIFTHLFAKSIKYVKKAFYYYRIDNNKSSIHNYSNAFSIINEHKFIEKKINNKSKITAAQKEAIVYKKIMNYYWNYNRLNSTSKKSFIKKISRQIQDMQINDNTPPIIKNRLRKLYTETHL